MTDAALSDAKETIATVISATIERDSDAQVTASVEEIPALSHAESDQADCAIAVSSSPCLLASGDTLLIEKCRKNSIPTAIVKPKYQRQSYDDRQLPPVVCIDREKPWYHNSTTTAITSSNNNNQQQHNHINNNVIVVGSSTTTSQPKKIQQLPHFERKQKKNLPIRNTVGGSVARGLVSEKEKFNSLRLCEKDIDSSSVAIVPPRKKESILMEKQQQQQQHQQTTKATTSPPVSTPTNIYVNDGGSDVVDYADDDKRINNCSIQKNMANISNNNNSSKCGNNNNKNNNNHHHHQRPLHHHPLHNYVRASTKTATMPSIQAEGAGASTATTSSISISRKVLPEKREKLSATSTQQTARYTKDISGKSEYIQRIYYININFRGAHILLRLWLVMRTAMVLK